MIDWEEFYNSFRKSGFVPGYEIQNRLGGGAFGEVYKARKSSIGKPYAIKFLKIDDQTGRDAVERELEQVRHFAQIDHPNLVTIEDMGVVLGVPFLIMGYAGEDTLARRMKRERLDVERALSYFVQTARGVLALHDRNLVHFDLKPSNIFLKGEVARVGDYGLAKLMTDGRSTLSFGRGTPHYMAPEMLKNRADRRADLYSLGVILYESIAGKLPWDGDSSGGIVLREDDHPPEFPADFPIALRVTVERCLRLAPDDRFGSVHELLEALGQTARQGDSIVLPKADAAAGPAPAPAAGSAEVETRTPVGGRSLARETATELARGAREVALGVWEGLRTARGPQSATATPPPVRAPTAASAAPASAPSSAPSSAKRTPRPEPPLSPAIPPGIPPAIAKGDVEQTQELSTELVQALAVLPAAGEATIPVPPRAQGGLAGTLFTTLALGVEVLVALVTGPVRSILQGVGRAGRGIVSRSKSVFGAVVRLLLFLVGMAALGAGLAALVYTLAVR